jgi:hypothetical protein
MKNKMLSEINALLPELNIAFKKREVSGWKNK